MDATGNVIVFGSFLVLAAIFAGGFFVSGLLGMIMIGVGVVGGLTWLFWFLRLASAMNSDI